MKTIDIPTLDTLTEAARSFMNLVKAGDRRLFAFYGDMGAGKTTFIRELARVMGVPDSQATNSPSFSLVNEYEAEPDGEKIYHFDFYRLDCLEEAIDMGVEDYWASGNLCFMEWPERVAPILPEETVSVKITVSDEDDSRRLEIYGL